MEAYTDYLISWILYKLLDSIRLKVEATSNAPIREDLCVEQNGIARDRCGFRLDQCGPPPRSCAALKARALFPGGVTAAYASST